MGDEMEKVVHKRLEEIPLNMIDIAEENVRHSQANANLEELKNSIEKMGLINPILLIEDKDRRYKLLVGQRRFLAFKALKKTRIPAIIIQNINHTSRQIVSLGENIHRRDLPYNDTINICKELFEKSSGPKKDRIEKIALEIGISLQTVARYLSYTLVPNEVRILVESKKLTPNQAYKITSAFWPNTEKIIKIAHLVTEMPKPQLNRALEIGMQNPKATVNEIAEEARKISITYKFTLKFDNEQTKLLKKKAEERNMDIEDLLLTIVDEFLKK